MTQNSVHVHRQHTCVVQWYLKACCSSKDFFEALEVWLFLSTVLRYTISPITATPACLPGSRSSVLHAIPLHLKWSVFENFVLLSTLVFGNKLSWALSHSSMASKYTFLLRSFIRQPFSHCIPLITDHHPTLAL